MSLTVCQENAAKQFLGFMATSEKYMVISGPPGVGKTYMQEHMIELLPNAARIATILGGRPLSQIALTATTNKATEVLQSKYTKDSVSTVHSRLGLTIKNDYRTGKTIVIKGKNHSPIHDTLLIVDEASTIDTPLLNLIDESTINSKVVFVGDHCQLGPVSENSSPAFNSGYLTSYLNTPVRTKDSPELTTLNNHLREMVETGIFKSITPIPGVIDFVGNDEMFDLLMHNFINNESAGHKIITYTNQAVQDYNQFIRTKRNLPESLIPGDTVISNTVTYFVNSDNRTSIEKAYIVYSVGEVRTDDLIPYYYVNTNAGTLRQPAIYTDLVNAIKAAANAKDWTIYFYLKEHFSDLRFTYACTAYKSQGSTYHTVYIDLSDILTCKDINSLIRQVYVAASRASHRVVFYGKWPF
ncbi:MAG: ATP-dependent DNA helicase [Cetobacterium sp.]|uniref:ATP-dependent DNA helicase n=1 Tax=Cetobacterium sp. TaxID=2071632 RepID=UPI003EE4C7AE